MVWFDGFYLFSISADADSNYQSVDRVPIPKASFSWVFLQLCHIVKQPGRLSGDPDTDETTTASVPKTDNRASHSREVGVSDLVPLATTAADDAVPSVRQTGRMLSYKYTTDPFYYAVFSFHQRQKNRPAAQR